MKLNFKKIASVLTGAIMLSSTMGFAAAASFPEPIVLNGTGDGAVVVTGGNHLGAASDIIAAIDIQTHLNSLVSSGGTGGSTTTGGDSVLIAKSSNNLNLGNTWGVLTGTINDEDLSTILADGKYTADDNDEANEMFSKGTEKIKFWILKNRFGEIGIVDVLFNGARMRFEDEPKKQF